MTERERFINKAKQTNWFNEEQLRDLIEWADMQKEENKSFRYSHYYIVKYREYLAMK